MKKLVGQCILSSDKFLYPANILLGQEMAPFLGFLKEGIDEFA